MVGGNDGQMMGVGERMTTVSPFKLQVRCESGIYDALSRWGFHGSGHCAEIHFVDKGGLPAKKEPGGAVGSEEETLKRARGEGCRLSPQLPEVVAPKGRPEKGRRET